MFGKTWNDKETRGLEAHGGITFNGKFHDSKLWWLGFDCAHLGDVCPGMQNSHFYYGPMDTYKDIDYVTHEVKSLAEQMKNKEGVK